ncbi:MarR family winged helix-turn-helix transcriptional regulator [Sneathiella limimaris]|uniref:MarR family winged helix-turn-helix transcriptional regulator n=1 Tax=Sneathiella limimaris TaxID=1964213 RepID=UPI00146B6037|nr:MarR family transcriptional regulator [Sneathiella limimaris]
MRTSQVLQTKIETALKEQGFPSLNWYDVLWEAEQADDKGLRLFELEQRLLLKQYGVSRLVERLENAGLLSRQKSDEDGRGYRIFITKEGRNLRRQMWSVYGTALDAELGGYLTDQEAEQLSGLLGKLLSNK